MMLIRDWSVMSSTFAAALLATSAAAAPVSWTGLGDGLSWSDPLNWSGNALPGPADDVTISVPATDPVIAISGVNPSIRSLSTSEILRFTAGTTFSVATTATSSAALRLAGGTVTGGAWSFTGAGAFQITGTLESRLNNAAVTGEIVATDVNGRLRMNTATSFTTLRFRGNNASVAFEPGSTISGQVLVDAAVTAHIDVTAAGTLTIAPTGVIATGPGLSATIDVGLGWWYSSDVTLDVQGVVSHAGSGTTTVDPAALSVAAGGRIENVGPGTTAVGVRRAPFTWTNAGTLRASAGVLTIADTFTSSGIIDVLGTGRVNLTEAWTNTGTIQLAGSARLDLGGTFTTAAMGTISRAGASTTVNITGQWNNTAATFNFTAATGSYTLVGGTITGGTITTAGGAGLIPGNGTNTLVGVAYAGEIVCEGNNSRVRVGAGTTLSGLRVRGLNGGASFAPGYVISFPIVIEGTGALGTVGFDTLGAGSLTLGPAASITAVGDWTGTLSVGPSWWDTACAFINQGTITLAGPSRTLNLGGTSFTNAASGSISASAGVVVNADVQGTDSASWSSAGSFSVADGTLHLRDNWSFSANATVANTTVNMDGIFTGASALRLQRTAGTVNLAGRLENTGQTTTLGPTTGSWRLVGGTVAGGTLATTATESLLPTNSGGTLDSVTLTRELAFDAAVSSARIRFLGSTTAPSVRLRGSNAGISFSPGAVINYPIISDAQGVATTHALDCTAAGGTLTIGPAGSFTTAPGSLSSIFLGEAWWASACATVINQGLVECGSLNRALRIVPATSFLNSGVVRVRNGADATIAALSGAVGGFDVADAGSSISLDGNYTLAGTFSVLPGTTATLRGTWGNSGSIAVNAGTLELDGSFSLANLGAFSNSGGSVSIIGTMNNAAGLTLSAATGSWTLAGGTINGGTLAQTQGARLLFAPNTIGTLNNVAFTSELFVSGTAARARILGTTSAPAWRVSGSSASLGFAPGRVLNEPVVAEGSSSKGLETESAGTLTIGPACTVRCTAGTLFVGDGYFPGGARTVTVQGTLEADGPTASIQVNPTTFSNLDAAGVLTGGTYHALDRATLLFSRPLARNAATILVSGAGGSTTFIDSLGENAGSLTITGGRDVSALAFAGSPAALVNSGTLVLGAGSRLTLGSGGHPAGFTQTPAGLVRFELGGLDPDSGFGNLRVNGTAALDGTVAAAYVNGFPRQCGQIFQVIDANSQSGQFAVRDLPPIEDTTLFLMFYDGADVRFSVSARADFNQDGFLDFFDYDDFVACFEGTFCPPGITADFNNDEFVDFFDYDDFVFRFEAGC